MEEVIKIAIVDDDRFFACKLYDNIQNLWSGKNMSVDIYNNPEHLLKKLEQGSRYKIYFLDIEMPDTDGIRLAKYIKQSGEEEYIVFITSYEKYALQSIKLEAFYYIMKEELDSELKKALEKIHKEECRKWKTRDFLLGANSKYKKVKLDDIFYIEKDGKDAVFYCKDAKYTERKPLKTIFKELPIGEFAYINNGQIVNLRCISKFNKDEIKLDSGIVLHCSRRMKKGLEEKMLSFWESL